MRNVIIDKILLIKYYCTNAIHNLETAQDNFLKINNSYYDILISELTYYISCLKDVRDNYINLANQRYINCELIDEILRITIEHLNEVKNQEMYLTDLVNIVIKDLKDCRNVLKDLT